MIEYRKMTPEDIVEVFMLEYSLFPTPWLITQYDYELRENPVSFPYVAIKEGKIIGFIIFWITFNSSTLCKIGVQEDYQHQGIGKAMMALMYQDLKAHEVETATLEVRVDNFNAIDFYLKEGYQKVSIKEHYYEDGCDAIYMMKVLI